MTKHLTFTKVPFDEVDHFINDDGFYLRCKHWEVENPKFLIHIMHGYGSHCEKFSEAVEKFNSKGGYVFSHDQVGFGESEGERANVKDYNIFVRDSLKLIETTSAKHPSVPVFIIGQSMGAALAVVCADRNPSLVTGVILLAGMLAPNPRVTGLTRMFVNVVSNILPTVTMTTLPSDNVDDAEEDPLKVRTIKSRMLMQMTYLGEKARDLASTFTVPFFALHGTADNICDKQLSKNFFEKSPVLHKQFQVYKGAGHDLIHDTNIDRQVLYDDIFAWIEKTI